MSGRCPRHVFIAGTGRAGTSFLVRYLDGLGLDTHLAHNGDAAWDERANAGLEDIPLTGRLSADMPYVVKSPWLFEYIDEVLARHAEFEVDAVIIPIRPLDEAAASRVVMELRGAHENFPWMAEFNRSWEHTGGVPGGGVFSLHPLDQARILAVGFHHLLERLVRADIPLILLDFPRLVLDPDYLFDKLAPALPLPPGMDRERARDIHRGLADSSKVRVGAELSTVASDRHAQGQTIDELDRVAIRRELVRLRGILSARDEQHATEAAEQVAAVEKAQAGKIAALEAEIAVARAAQLIATTERDARLHSRTRLATRPLRKMASAITVAARVATARLLRVGFRLSPLPLGKK